MQSINLLSINRQLNKKVKHSQTVRLQKLILSELINFYPLKSTENQRFSDDIRGNRS